jgi:hypothetical protein
MGEFGVAPGCRMLRVFPLPVSIPFMGDVNTVDPATPLGL